MEISGGDKLAKYLGDLSSKINGPATLRVGFLAGGTYPDGTSIPMIAASEAAISATATDVSITNAARAVISHI